MSNRISTIERLNRNYKSLMGKPPLRQSLLHEDLRATQAMSGLVNATPFIQRPIISNSSVLRTVTTNTPPTIMVNAPQMVPVISTLPTVSAVTNSINVNHNYQQTHFGLDGGPKLQVVTTANSSAVQQTQYIETEEIVESTKNWPKMPRLLATSSRVAPPYHEPPYDRCKCGGCPLWLLALLVLLSLIGLIVGVVWAKTASTHSQPLKCDEGFYLKDNKCVKCEGQSYWNGQDCVLKVTPQQNIETNTSTSEIVKDLNQIKPCAEGFFMFQGQCIQCPQGSSWNGTNCILKMNVTKIADLSQNKTQLNTTSENNTVEQPPKKEQTPIEANNTANNTINNTANNTINSTVNNTTINTANDTSTLNTTEKTGNNATAVNSTDNRDMKSPPTTTQTEPDDKSESNTTTTAETKAPSNTTTAAITNDNSNTTSETVSNVTNVTANTTAPNTVQNSTANTTSNAPETSNNSSLSNTAQNQSNKVQETPSKNITEGIEPAGKPVAQTSNTTTSTTKVTTTTTAATAAADTKSKAIEPIGEKSAVDNTTKPKETPQPKNTSIETTQPPADNASTGSSPQPSNITNETITTTTTNTTTKKEEAGSATVANNSVQTNNSSNKASASVEIPSATATPAASTEASSTPSGASNTTTTENVTNTTTTSSASATSGDSKPISPQTTIAATTIPVTPSTSSSSSTSSKDTSPPAPRVTPQRDIGTVIITHLRFDA